MITPAIKQTLTDWQASARAFHPVVEQPQHPDYPALQSAVLDAKERWRQAVADALTWSADPAATRTAVPEHLRANWDVLQQAQQSLDRVRAQGPYDLVGTCEEIAQGIEDDLVRFVNEV